MADVARWVRIYSYITWVGVGYGLAAAHVPALIGQPWSTCRIYPSPGWCIAAFHLFDFPLLTFNAFLAWYGLRRFPARRAQYIALLGVAVMVNLAFFTFETVLLFDSLRRSAPTWESVGLASIAVMLLAGVALSVVLRQRLVEPGVAASDA
jgi:D-arabinono-1,4-lactone oxidase